MDPTERLNYLFLLGQPRLNNYSRLDRDPSRPDFTHKIRRENVKFTACCSNFEMTTAKEKRPV